LACKPCPDLRSLEADARQGRKVDKTKRRSLLHLIGKPKIRHQPAVVDYSEVGAQRFEVAVDEAAPGRGVQVNL
jgi:hypothetical protein